MNYLQIGLFGERKTTCVQIVQLSELLMLSSSLIVLCDKYEEINTNLAMDSYREYSFWRSILLI